MSDTSLPPVPGDRPADVEIGRAPGPGAGRDYGAVVDAGRAERTAITRRRGRAALGVSFAVLLVWSVYVTAAGHWGRVVDNWASALTMVFGSFVAGSTPQGGGAVAFPVFTKVLEIDTAVARSFSLCIQTVGMGAASLAIVLNRRAVAWRAIALGAPVAVLTFVASTVLLGRDDLPFWPSRIPGAYVKVTFTILVAAMALIVYLGYRVQLLERVERLELSRPRVVVLVVLAAAIGGLAASLTGSGADVIIYLAIVVVVGVTPRVGVPTSVVMMAIVSVVGFVLHGVIDGQLDVALVGDRVAAVGGRPVAVGDAGPAFASGGGLEAGRFDLFGLWLAAAPVVAFGAPLGSWVSSLASDRQLVRFVVALAAAETVSTIVFLDGLIVGPDPALIAYAVGGSILVITGLWSLSVHRRRILGLPPLDLDGSFTRSRLDTGPGFRDQLGRRPRSTGDEGGGG